MTCEDTRGTARGPSVPHGSRRRGEAAGVAVPTGQHRGRERHPHTAARQVAATPPDDITLVPAQPGGPSDAARARTMADVLIAPAARTTRQGLDLLRRLFPNAPLTVRAAALGALMRRQLTTHRQMPR